MRKVLSVVVAVLIFLVAYQYAPSPLLPVEGGDAILVTGSHTGIGKHAALTLAKEGYVVFCGVRKESHGDELIKDAQRFQINTNKIKPILLDVTNAEQIRDAVQTISDFVSDRGLKGLFNNAGISLGAFTSRPPGTSVEHLPLEFYRKSFDVNYFGTVAVTQAFLPLLRHGKGRIVNNASLAGFVAGPFFSAYSSTKFAVEALSDSLRRELNPHGVFVSILEPGFVQTPIFKGFDIPEGQGVYKEFERSQYKLAARDALSASSPRVTSAAVVHAMRATKPRIRYLVGHMSGACKLLSMLPASWADALMRAAHSVGQHITEQELVQLMERTDAIANFEL